MLDKTGNNIKSELKNKKVCLCLNESTDHEKKSVLNVIICIIGSHKPTLLILLPSKRQEKCTNEVQ